MWNRIIVGILLALVLAAAFCLGNTVRMVLLTVLTLCAVYEMQKLMSNKGLHICAWPLYAFAGLYCVVYSVLGTAMMLFLLLLLCAVAVMAERILNQKRSAEDCFAALVVLIYPLSLFVALMLLAVSFPESVGLTALLLAFAAPLMGDTLAYFIGSFFGKHKLCPQISPKKTVEGSVASVAGSVLGGLAVFFIQNLWGGATSLLPLLVLGCICGVLGQIGDLFASTIKRWAQVKDFGTIFAGHGGVVDRLDSVLFCSPVIFLYFYASVSRIIW